MNSAKDNNIGSSKAFLILQPQLLNGIFQPSEYLEKLWHQQQKFLASTFLSFHIQNLS